MEKVRISDLKKLNLELAGVCPYYLDRLTPNGGEFVLVITNKLKLTNDEINECKSILKSDRDVVSIRLRKVDLINS